MSRSCRQLLVGDSVLESLPDERVHANQRVNLAVPLVQPESRLIDVPCQMFVGDMMPRSIDAAF